MDTSHRSSDRGSEFLGAIRVAMGADLVIATLRLFAAVHRWRVVARRDLVNAFRSADVATDAIVRAFTPYR